MPPSLLIDENGHVVHSFGDAGAYLKEPRGRPSPAVLDMVKDALRTPLSGAIDRVRRTGRPTTLARLPLARSAEPPLLQRLVVEMPDGQPGAQRCLLVSFDNRPTAGGPPAPAVADDEAQSRIDELDQALATALAHLVEAMPEAAAIARRTSTDSQPRLVAANARMADAASAAGLATPLEGTALTLLLSGFLGAAGHPDLKATVAGWWAEDRSARLWPLAAGQALSAETVPIASNSWMIVVRLGPQSALSSDAATA